MALGAILFTYNKFKEKPVENPNIKKLQDLNKEHKIKSPFDPIKEIYKVEEYFKYKMQLSQRQFQSINASTQAKIEKFRQLALKIEEKNILFGQTSKQAIIEDKIKLEQDHHQTMADMNFDSNMRQTENKINRIKNEYENKKILLDLKIKNKISKLPLKITIPDEFNKIFNRILEEASLVKIDPTKEQIYIIPKNDAVNQDIQITPLTEDEKKTLSQYTYISISPQEKTIILNSIENLYIILKRKEITLPIPNIKHQQDQLNSYYKNMINSLDSLEKNLPLIKNDKCIADNFNKDFKNMQKDLDFIFQLYDLYVRRFPKQDMDIPISKQLIEYNQRKEAYKQEIKQFEKDNITNPDFIVFMQSKYYQDNLDNFKNIKKKL